MKKREMTVQQIITKYFTLYSRIYSLLSVKALQRKDDAGISEIAIPHYNLIDLIVYTFQCSEPSALGRLKTLIRNDLLIVTRHELSYNEEFKAGEFKIGMGYAYLRYYLSPKAINVFDSLIRL